MKNRKTMRDVYRFIKTADVYMRQKTKFAYALSKVYKKSVRKLLEDHEEKLEELSIELSAVDEKGLVLVTENGYRMTKENQAKMRSERAKLLDLEVAVEPFYVDVVPENLTYLEIENLRGFVIKEDYEPTCDGERQKTEIMEKN